MKIKKYILLIFLFAGLYNLSFSQTVFEKVSKQYSIETGYQYIFKTDFDSVEAGGYTFTFDYAWKLSGYNKKAEAYLSVPIGYSYHPSESNSVSILFYGWTVRHYLAKDKKVMPFIGYALLLNQFRYSNVEGSVFGHQTKFEFGADYQLKERLNLFAKLEYSLGRFPSLGSNTSNKMQTVEFKMGVRF